MSKTPNIPNDPIEFDDMQGLVRFGHGALVEADFTLCVVKDPTAAKQWLRDAPVTSAGTLDTPPQTALQIAFTADGLAALGLGGDAIKEFAQPFVSGMAGEESRSRRLGDLGPNAPENWSWDGAQTHVLLMLYAREGGLESWKNEVLNASFDTAFE